MAATLKISIGFNKAIAIIKPSSNLFCIIIEISAISINANKNIQIKNEIPRATSLVFTNAEIKKAIPKKADESENSKPVYKKKISQGISAPIDAP